jgi:DNA-binding MarR family transcriptional regulator
LSTRAGIDLSDERLVPDAEEAELEAWRRFLGAHASITRRLDADLTRSHRLTLTQYEVLLHLARAPDSRMRMSELAERALLTRSGISRLVSGLEQAGLVKRVSCPGDARGAYACLTGGGRAKVREAASTHLEGVRQLYLLRFSKRDLKKLEALLGALPGSCDGEQPKPSEAAGGYG